MNTRGEGRRATRAHETPTAWPHSLPTTHTSTHSPPFTDQVRVPRPIANLCTRDVLVMEYLPGVKLIDGLKVRCKVGVGVGKVVLVSYHQQTMCMYLCVCVCVYLCVSAYCCCDSCVRLIVCRSQAFFRRVAAQRFVFNGAETETGRARESVCVCLCVCLCERPKPPPNTNIHTHTCACASPEPPLQWHDA